MFPFMWLVLLLPHGRFGSLYFAFSVTYLRLPWTLCSPSTFAFSWLIFRFLVAYRRNDWGQSLFQLGGDDETAYTLDTYPGHSLDTCDISIDFPTHFRSIFDDLDILWFISTSRHTSDITCWSHSHCDILPITSQHASHLFHPSYLRPIISLEIEVFSLISHGHWSIIVMHY